MSIKAQRKQVNKSIITVPIFFLLIYIVFTFLPVIYTYMPFFGKIKIVLLAGIGLLITYTISANVYKNLGAWNNTVVYAWVGFISVMVLSLLVSQDRGLTLQAIDVNIRYFVIFAVMIRIVDSAKRLELVLGVFAACGVGMALNTNINYLLFGRTLGGFRAIGIESGLFGDPNDLAMLLNTTLGILLYFLVKSKRKVVTGMGIIVVVTGIMFSYSRGGFLGLCAVALCFLILKGKRKKSYVVITVTAAIIFWTFAPQNYKDRISTIREESQIDEETGRYSGRLQTWIDVLPEIRNRPLFGAGAGCSIYIAGVTLRDWHNIHNSFLQVFIEMGILGFGFYMSVLIIPLRQYRRFRRKQTEDVSFDRERFEFILLSFAAFVTGAFFLPQAYSPILFLLSGLAVVEVELLSRVKAIAETKEGR